MSDSDHASPVTSPLLQYAEVHNSSPLAPPPAAHGLPSPDPQSPLTLAAPDDIQVDNPHENGIEKDPVSKPIAATPLVGFHQHLKCHLCKNLVNAPIMLPCLDRFCQNCLEDHCRSVAASVQHSNGTGAGEGEGEEILTDEAQDMLDYEDEVILSDSEDSDQHDVYGLENFTDPEQSSRASSVLSDIHRKQHVGVHGVHVHCPFGCAKRTGITVNVDSFNISGMPQVSKCLDHLKQEYDLEERLASGQQQCTNCVRGNIAIAACKHQDCPNNTLCEECLVSHINTRRTREHVIVHVSELRKEEDKAIDEDKVPLQCGPKYKVLKGVQLKPWYCDFHEDKIVKFYCEEHEEVFCSDCAILQMERMEDPKSKYHKVHSHDKCVKFDVNNKYEKEWNVPPDTVHPLVEKLDKARELLSKFEAAEQNMKTMKKSLKARALQVQEEVHLHFDEILRQVELEKKILIIKTARIYKKKIQRLDEHISEVKKIQKPFKRSIPFIEDFIYTSAAVPVQYYFLKKHIIDQLQFLCSEYQNHLNQPLEDATIVFDANQNFSIHDNMGKVYSTPCVKEFEVVDLPNELNAFNQYHFVVQARDILQTRVCGVLPQLRVVIRPETEVPEPEEMHGLVRYNTSEGTYIVSLFPPGPGNYKIYPYKRLPAPIDWELVRGEPIDITVVAGGLLLDNVFM